MPDPSREAAQVPGRFIDALTRALAADRARDELNWTRRVNELTGATASLKSRSSLVRRAQETIEKAAERMSVKPAVEFIDGVEVRPFVWRMLSQLYLSSLNCASNIIYRIASRLSARRLEPLGLVTDPDSGWDPSRVRCTASIAELLSPCSAKRGAEPIYWVIDERDVHQDIEHVLIARLRADVARAALGVWLEAQFEERGDFEIDGGMSLIAERNEPSILLVKRHDLATEVWSVEPEMLVPSPTTSHTARAFRAAENLWRACWDECARRGLVWPQSVEFEFVDEARPSTLHLDRILNSEQTIAAHIPGWADPSGLFAQWPNHDCKYTVLVDLFGAPSALLQTEELGCAACDVKYRKHKPSYFDQLARETRDGALSVNDLIAVQAATARRAGCEINRDGHVHFRRYQVLFAQQGPTLDAGNPQLRR